MKRFNTFLQSEVPVNETFRLEQARLRLRCSAPAAVFVTEEGVEACLGVATDFDSAFGPGAEIRIDAPQGVRAFVEVRPSRVVSDDGQVFTNLDKMPVESGIVAEIGAMRREMRLEARQAMLDLRKTHKAIQAEMAVLPDQGDFSLADDDPVVVDDDQPG